MVLATPAEMGYLVYDNHDWWPSRHVNRRSSIVRLAQAKDMRICAMVRAGPRADRPRSGRSCRCAEIRYTSCRAVPALLRVCRDQSAPITTRRTVSSTSLGPGSCLRGSHAGRAGRLRTTCSARKAPGLRRDRHPPLVVLNVRPRLPSPGEPLVERSPDLLGGLPDLGEVIDVRHEVVAAPAQVVVQPAA